jgi:hypothetical protein
MLKLKSQLTCSYCSKILKDPILLPCEESICREHLSERSLVKQNKIKCTKCKVEFEVKDSEFKSSNVLAALIESRSYLSDEEINLKQQLEVSIKKFFQLYDEFAQNKAKLDLDVFDHFQEMRFQIDEHREVLKKKIDDIALEMVDKIKSYEKIYLKDLKEYFSSFDGSKSLENKLNDIEDTFRNPNLLIQTIQDMQRKQDESLNDIQFKLNEMNQVKEFLEATNEYRPNLSSLNQNANSLFGSIKLDGYWLDSFERNIKR